MLNPRLWIYAFGQAFFSLSIAGNGTVIYGSYLSETEDVVSSARNVAIFDTLAALLASFVIIPGMAVGGAELSSGGPGLMFIYLVNVFNGMPGGKIVGIIFYICVLFAGMSSLVNLYEAPVATLEERFGFKRPVLSRELFQAGWMQFQFIFVHWEQCLRRLCSSGLQEKTLRLMRLIREEIRISVHGLCHLESMF